MAASTKIIDRTPELLRDLQRRALSFVTQGGALIQSKAAPLAPVDTGALRNSINVVSYVEDGRPTSETGPTVDYAEYVEFGVRSKPNYPVQPFMEPGFQAALSGIERLAAQVLKV